MYQNRATLIGFLGKDGEPRVTNTNQIAYTALSLATKTSWKDKQTGEYVGRTEWHRCIVWGKLGELAKTLLKGAHVQIEGELRSREYVEKVGEKKNKVEVKRRVWEIRTQSILKLDRAAKDEADSAPDAEATDQVPF
ncbi:MAG: single-stranded DNA-binding protein [Acidobacteriota bacterium]|nr:single-stranded DNA-binding protein [Acidobacteriota bacterium]